jgi:ferredoxin
MFSVAAFSILALSLAQVMSPRPLLIMERFWQGAGWLEIAILGAYGAFVAQKMADPAKSPIWRVRIWTLFSAFFFIQLILGLSGFEEFLMTGKLHFPVPAMIVAGPVYRAETSVMTIIFISTLLLSGPAWCSQLCYFGAYDALLSKGKTPRKPLKHKNAIKHTFLILVISTALLLRFFGITGWIPSLAIIIFGVAGILIMILISRKQKKMIHCTLYCPIGTVVRYTKYVSPFRMKIAPSCTQCMACIPSCKYDALNKTDILNLKPGSTCTLCGDCVTSCHNQSIQYKFIALKPEHARWLYLFITISLHVIFLGLARI